MIRNFIKAMFLTAIISMLSNPAIAEKRRIGPDTITRTTPMISSEQVGIHDGRGFSISGVSSGLATGTYFFSSIDTATNSIHLHNLDIWSSVSWLQIFITENPDAVDTTSSTTMIPINRNRESSTVATAAFYNNADASPATGGYSITGAATSTAILTITGAATETVEIGDMILIDGSTGNDGAFYVFDVTFASPTTTIQLNTIADATADGKVHPLGALLEMTVSNDTVPSSQHLSNRDTEFILDGDSVYLIGIYNAGSSAADFGVWSFWTEDE